MKTNNFFNYSAYFVLAGFLETQPFTPVETVQEFSVGPRASAQKVFQIPPYFLISCTVSARGNERRVISDETLCVRGSGTSWRLDPGGVAYLSPWLPGNGHCSNLCYLRVTRPAPTSMTGSGMSATPGVANARSPDGLSPWTVQAPFS